MVDTVDNVELRQAINLCVWPLYQTLLIIMNYNQLQSKIRLRRAAFLAEIVNLVWSLFVFLITQPIWFMATCVEDPINVKTEPPTLDKRGVLKGGRLTHTDWPNVGLTGVTESVWIRNKRAAYGTVSPSASLFQWSTMVLQLKYVPVCGTSQWVKDKRHMGCTCATGFTTLEPKRMELIQPRTWHRATQPIISSLWVTAEPWQSLWLSQWGN